MNTINCRFGLMLSLMLLMVGSPAAQSGTETGMCEGYHHLLTESDAQQSMAPIKINPVLRRGYDLAKTAKCDLCHGIDGVRNTEAWGTLEESPVIGGQRVKYLRAALQAYAAGAYWLYKIEDEGVVIDAMTLNLDMPVNPRFSQDGERVMNGAVKELPGWNQDPAKRDVKRLLDPDALTAVATWFACGPDGNPPFSKARSAQQ